MARQSFIWTALPNGYTADGRALRLSVLLSPRLDPEADPPHLASFFPDWQDWPATLRQARFEFTYNGQTIAVRGDDLAGDARIDDRLGTADSAVWIALFKKSQFVRGFAYKDLSNNAVLSYDTVAVHDLVQGLYKDLARTAGDDRPLVSDIADEPHWRTLIETTRNLDRAVFDRETGLRDPQRLIDAAVDSHPERQGPNGLPQTLARFQAFHTPPATPKPTNRKRTDDNRIDATWMEYERATLPDPATLTKELDFHQIVSSMGSYPTLLRRLGLVTDLLLPREKFTAAADAALSVRVSFPAEALRIARSGDAAPETRTLLDDRRFQSVSDPTADFRISDGLLELHPERFALLQLDVDSAGLKIANFARSLGRRDAAESRVDPVTRQEDAIGAPSLRNAGLMLVQRDRWYFLKGRFLDNKSGNAAIESQFQGAGSGPTLHAEDVVRGYHIDIWESVSGTWRSLCRREARYDLDEGGVIVQPEPEEESILRLAATKSSDPASNPNLVYLHEALVSWTGWSLGAPPPGRAITADDSFDTSSAQSNAEVPPGLKFTSRFNAVPKSLPRLRFGRSYWIRARAVDLAGNALAPQTKDFGPERPQDNARRYLRFEPVMAPVLALLERGGAIEVPDAGESIARIAIRSFNNTPPDNHVLTAALAHRVAAPPQVSIREAEQHGMLDGGGAVDSSTFRMLADQKDVDPHDPAATIREVRIKTQGPLAADAIDTTFAVYGEGRVLTYLPDPLAVEIAARLFDHPDIADDEIITIPLYPAGNWPEAQPFVIEAYENPLEKPYFDVGSRTLRIPLPKGVQAKLRLSMKLAPDALEKMGVFAWLDAPDQAAQRKRAIDGQHWMLTPWRVIDLVHAVQRPLVTPEITTIAIWPRAPGSTFAVPALLASCSIDSTDRMDLLAEWHEPIDDAAVAESAAASADRQRRDVAFPVKITDPRFYTPRDAAHPAGGFPDHTVSGPDLIGVNIVGEGQPLAFSRVLVPTKTHEFHDTRYRRIEYWFDATTRFREFLPTALLLENGTPSENQIKVTGPRAVTWIPNTAPPPAPKVLYVVPTFGWTRTLDDAGKASVWRRGGGLRVYLDRPWSASGYGEMLAVVLPQTGFTGNPDLLPLGHPYKKYVTQWGNDPVWDSPFVAGIAPRRSDFPLSRLAPDPAGAWLPPNAPASEADQKPERFLVAGLQPPGLANEDAPIEIAPHDVFYDPERQLWYCDIEIEAGAAYFPFIRLALARYQPTSTLGAHLSNVVLADFMALTTDRWLTVTPDTDPQQRHVVVFGMSYSESSGHREAAHALAMSLINTLTHQVEDLAPAKIAASSVIDIWVEKLDSRQGEDFGWHRIDEAVIRPTGATEAPSRRVTRSPFVRTVTATERLKARELIAAQEFDALAQENLIDLIRALQTLWEGDVILPASVPTDGRYRLVIAEYEEYLVDDTHANDAVPTKSGRRLVFVDHLELR